MMEGTPLGDIIGDSPLSLTTFGSPICAPIVAAANGVSMTIMSPDQPLSAPSPASSVADLVRAPTRSL